MHILLEHGSCLGFRNITRPSDRNNNAGTCIDNIFIKLDKINYKTFTLKIPLSDLFPIFMYINKIRATKDAHAVNRLNYNKLKSETELINWSELSLIDEPNLALNNLVSRIKICLKKAEYSKKNILYPRKNWITSAIIKSCVTKEKLYKLWKEDLNNTKKREKYREFNLILKKIINKSKVSFDKEQFQAKMKNPKFVERTKSKTKMTKETKTSTI